MSKFAEYIKLVPKGLKNPLKIIEGVYNTIQLNHGNLPEDEKEEILRRRLICNDCPFNSVLAKESKEYFEAFGKHYETEREDIHCSCCGCNLDLKTSSLGADCGIKSEEQTKDLEFKWTKYK